MDSDLYIWIPNWDGPDGFQHYKERDPIWIKCYTRLLAHDEYLALSSHRRGVLHGIWLAYASSSRRLRADHKSLSYRLQVRVTAMDVEALSDAGFVEVVASKLLAERLQDASNPLALARVKAETETETEKTPLTPQSGEPGVSDILKDVDATPRQRRTNPRATGTNPRANGKSPRQLGINDRELRRYTGCKMTRGTHGTGFKHTPLGTDKPPADWPHDKPTKDEVEKALAAQKVFDDFPF